MRGGRADARHCIARPTFLRAVHFMALFPISLAVCTTKARTLQQCKVLAFCLPVCASSPPLRRPSFKTSPYHQLTRANTLCSGQNGRCRRSRPWRAAARLRPAVLPAPIFSRWKGPLGVFRERKPRTARQTRQPGFAPGNEDNKAGRDFSPEKPCLLLSTDGRCVC